MSTIRCALAFLAAVFVLNSVNCDVEMYPDHFRNPDVYKPDYSDEELTSRISLFINKIDVNKDGYITYEELSNWIFETFQTMDRDHAETYLREYDSNGDGKISLDEYLKGVYKISEHELKRMNDQNSREVLKSIKAERARFESADVNKDNYLSLDEFVVFLHPENYDSMAFHELERIFSDFDRDHDGVVSREEFTDISYRGASQSEQMKSQFDQLDSDKNDVLTPEELRTWLLPSLMPTAQSEAKRLINLTDTNHDGRLSKDEILKEKRIWSNSPTVVRSRELWDEL